MYFQINPKLTMNSMKPLQLITVRFNYKIRVGAVRKRAKFSDADMAKAVELVNKGTSRVKASKKEDWPVIT